MCTLDPTIQYYDRNAATFVQRTVGASMSESLDAFASMLPPRAGAGLGLR